MTYNTVMSILSADGLMMCFSVRDIAAARKAVIRSVLQSPQKMLLTLLFICHIIRIEGISHASEKGCDHSIYDIIRGERFLCYITF